MAKTLSSPSVTPERQERMKSLMISQARSWIDKAATESFCGDMTYVDFSKVKSFKRLEDRYRVMSDILSEQELDELGLEPDHMPELQLCRYNASYYLGKRIRQKGIMMIDAAASANIELTSFSKATTNDKLFAISGYRLVQLCYNVLGDSCNKFLFGTNGKIVLPGIYSVVAEKYDQMNSTEKGSLLKLSDIARKQYERDHLERDGEIAYCQSESALTTSRIRTLIYAKGCKAAEFLDLDNDPNKPKKERETFPPRRYWNLMGAFVKDNSYRYNPGLQFLMFLSIETGQALDYFVAEDFIDRVPCYYRSGNKEVRIKDTFTIKMLSNIFSMDETASTPIIASIIAKSVTK